MSEETAFGRFQRLAGRVLSQHFGVWLAPGFVGTIAVEFGLVSANRHIVGTALWWDGTEGKPLREWLEAHADFMDSVASRVEFYGLEADGAITTLASSDAPFDRATPPRPPEHPLMAFAGRWRYDPFQEDVDAYIREQRERDRAEAARTCEA